MFSHVMLGSNDIARSKVFYDALLGAIGGPPSTESNGRLVYVHRGKVLLIGAPIDGEPSHQGNGWTIGFGTSSPEETDAWHKAGVAHGGTAIEDPPGVRPGAFGPLYLAYLRDPDGNKLCAMHRMPT